MLKILLFSIISSFGDFMVRTAGKCPNCGIRSKRKKLDKYAVSCENCGFVFDIGRP